MGSGSRAPSYFNFFRHIRCRMSLSLWIIADLLMLWRCGAMCFMYIRWSFRWLPLLEKASLLEQTTAILPFQSPHHVSLVYYD
ncbi:hypothetical protein Plhal304r1_c020g0070571 [Plasmopara halstedii]